MASDPSIWLDTDRLSRTGDSEVVFGLGKTPAQTVNALRALRDAHPARAALATRVDGATVAAIREEFGDEPALDPVGLTAVIGPLPQPNGKVLVVSAGSADEQVAAEAATTVAVHGSEAWRIRDAGVAGLHRILSVKDELAAADAVIVCAGMDGALPSVVGGLTGVPVIAVPTSVGYGASFGGVAALLSMLNSCAPGVVVVNIDNGYGAGVAAARIARRA